MDAKTLKYVGIGGGVLLLFILMRGGGGGGSASGTSATLQSFADTNATAISYAQIAGENARAQMVAQSSNIAVIADMAKTQADNSTVIIAQSIAQVGNLQQARVNADALITQSAISAHLANNLGLDQIKISQIGADMNTNDNATKVALENIDANTQITLARFGKDINTTNQKYGLAKQFDANASRFLTKFFTGSA
jgi:hypothetical protein